MSNWNFRSIGSFENDAAVDHWARMNGVNARDVKTRRGGEGKVEAEVRESAYDASDNNIFGKFDRNSGFQ